MRRLLMAMAVTLSMAALMLLAAPALADLCFTCRGGTPCHYCRAEGGKDTQQARERCKKLGCEITGYGSCPTAANYKVCMLPAPSGARPTSQTSAYFPF